MIFAQFVVSVIFVGCILLAFDSNCQVEHPKCLIAIQDDILGLV